MCLTWKAYALMLRPKHFQFQFMRCLNVKLFFSCTRFCFQLRGEAGKRQVDGNSIALQHNIGIGGAAVVTTYKQYKQVLYAKL